jgi:hypothetical protein
VPELNPSGIPAVGGTPYVTPAILRAAPTGILWDSLATLERPDRQRNWGELLNICSRATAQVNGYCNQPLRATVDTETLYGPGGDFRFQMKQNGVARLLLSRSPVTSVIGGQVSPAYAFPEQWTSIPAYAFKPEVPLIGVYGTTSPGASGDGGQAVLLGPGYVGWWGGASEVQVTYVNGWPHGSVQAATEAGATELTIDDATGWGPPSGFTSGATGTLYDPGQQEAFTVTASTAVSGPATLTLAAPLSYPHQAGVVASTLPGTVMQAAILFATALALVGGATAVTQQAIPGVPESGGKAAENYAAEAELMIHPYKRVI